MASETETFGYDFLDRLTSASGPYSESYAYDPLGNITSKGSLSYTYGTKPHAVTNVGSTSYAYDNNGNMTTRGSQTLTWDMENKLIAVSDNGTAQFVYDGNGNRVKKTEGGETILYINKYYEKNLTTSVVTTNYYLGANLIAQRKGTDLQYVHQDHLGGTSVTSDSGGDQIGTISYFPFGATRSGSVPTDIKFTGQRLDSTGLYYYNARYYDPNIGRFISSDSIVPDPANPQALNRYSYVLNNPLRYIDPSGHWDMSPYGPTSSSTGWGDGGDGGNGNGDNGTGNPQCPNCPPDTSPNSNTACPPGCFYTTDPANPLTSHVCICPDSLTGICAKCVAKCGEGNINCIINCILDLSVGKYDIETQNVSQNNPWGHVSSQIIVIRDAENAIIIIDNTNLGTYTHIAGVIVEIFTEAKIIVNNFSDIMYLQQYTPDYPMFLPWHSTSVFQRGVALIPAGRADTIIIVISARGGYSTSNVGFATSSGASKSFTVEFPGQLELHSR